MARIHALLVSLVVCSASCSIAFQDSVRSSGVYCSTSRFYYVSDIVIGAAFAYLVAANNGPGESYIPAGLFGASALLGIYKRGNCVRHRETASPEEWARDAETQRREDEARAITMHALAHELQQPIATEVASPPAAPPTPSNPTTVPSGSTTLTINGHTYTDRPNGELGRLCGVDNNTCTSPAYMCVLVTSTSGMCAPESQSSP